MGITRRDFLMKVGQAGGYGAAFTMMQSLGLLPVMASAAATVRYTGSRSCRSWSHEEWHF